MLGKKRFIIFIISVAGLISAILLTGIYYLLPSFFWPFFYWCFLILYLFFIRIFQRGSGFSLWVAFILFLVSGLITSISMRGAGEFLMRLSVIGWLVGLVQSMREYKKMG